MLPTQPQPEARGLVLRCICANSRSFLCAPSPLFASCFVLTVLPHARCFQFDCIMLDYMRFCLWSLSSRLMSANQNVSGETYLEMSASSQLRALSASSTVTEHSVTPLLQGSVRKDVRGTAALQRLALEVSTLGLEAIHALPGQILLADPVPEHIGGDSHGQPDSAKMLQEEGKVSCLGAHPSGTRRARRGAWTGRAVTP